MNYRDAPPDAPLLVVSSQVVALDRTNGKQRWIYELEGRGAVVRRFAMDGDRLFVFDNVSNLHCIDIATGKLLGRVELPTMLSTNTMLLDGDRIYLSADRRVAALDRNGTLLWDVDVPANQSHSLGGLGVPGGNISQIDYSTSS